MELNTRKDTIDYESRRNSIDFNTQNTRRNTIELNTRKESLRSSSPTLLSSNEYKHSISDIEFDTKVFQKFRGKLLTPVG